jgi:hypothetical protein
MMQIPMQTHWIFIYDQSIVGAHYLPILSFCHRMANHFRDCISESSSCMSITALG